MTVAVSQTPILRKLTANSDKIVKYVELSDTLALWVVTRTLFLLGSSHASLQSPEGGRGEEGSLLLVRLQPTYTFVSGGTATLLQCSIRQ